MDATIIQYFRKSYFHVSYRRRMPGIMAWQRPSLGDPCKSSEMAALLISFKMSFLRKFLTSFSPFAAVFLFGVAGLAETFPFLSVSGPFLLDFPGFQVPSDSIFPSQLWSSSRALPLHLHFCVSTVSNIMIIL